MAITKCPKCQTKIENIEYECQYTSWGKEWGTADFNRDPIDTTDSNESEIETDDYSYKCPECEKELSLEELQNLEDIEEDKPLTFPDEPGFEYYGNINEGQEPIKRIETTNETGIIAQENHYGQKIKIFICNKCKRKTIAEEIDNIIIEEKCKCGKTLTVEKDKIIKY